MSFDRKDRQPLGIGEIDGERYPALNIALPLDDSDENHAVLTGRKVGCLQLIEFLSKTDAELEVSLKPATWIVVEFDGPPALKDGHQVVATVLSGGDPDWRWVSADGNRPKTIASYDLRRIKEPRIRIKTRPGEYRMRFEIASVRTKMEETPLIDEERSVIVPEKGEAKLWYTIPGK